jgi:hypothetical protein
MRQSDISRSELERVPEDVLSAALRKPWATPKVILSELRGAGAGPITPSVYEGPFTIGSRPS